MSAFGSLSMTVVVELVASPPESLISSRVNVLVALDCGQAAFGVKTRASSSLVIAAAEPVSV